MLRIVQRKGYRPLSAGVDDSREVHVERRSESSRLVADQ